ncbi:beta strand repeat-containing protein [Tessaracoccus lubricantis]|uniref:beta strand repeat-containing protein n=1 Tax=Tessaracoccus lubricantis TaxID=545543 RepID=UPI0031EA1489
MQARADGPTTFTNSTPINVTSPTETGPASTTPYPSPVTVSGLNGPITNVSLALRGVTHEFVGDLDVMLVAPTGQAMIVMSDAGEPYSWLPASNATITLADGAGAFPATGPLPSGTYSPTNNNGYPDTFPAPAPSPGGATTFAAAFTGLAPNGTWRLYVTDNATGDDGIIAGGWSLTITTATTAAATQTSAGSLVSQVFTDQTSTLWAEVTSGGQPVTTGTVRFHIGATTLGTGSLNAAGRAQVSVASTSLPEGITTVTATYSGSAEHLSSAATFSHEVISKSVTEGFRVCNAAPLTISDGPASVYPKRVLVSGQTGTVTYARVYLDGLRHPFTADLDVMLVSPTGESLIVLSDVPGSLDPARDVIVTDEGYEVTDLTGQLVITPTNYGESGTDVFPAPAPTPSTHTTFADAFTGVSPNGLWSLYVADDAVGDAGALDKWCLELRTSNPTTITLNAPTTVSAGSDVVVTANVAVEGDNTPVTGGTVTWTVDGHASTSPVGPDGTASLTLPVIPRGVHTVAASYSGTGNWDDSTATPVTITAQASTAVSLTAPATVAAGSSFSVTARVNAPSGTVGTGTISYSVDGGARVEAGPVAAGAATFTIPALSRGAHQLVAYYTGADGWRDSTSATSTVTSVASTAVAIAAPATVALGNPLTMTATVTAPDGAVTGGQVAMHASHDDSTSTKTVGADGKASFTVADVPRGSHTFSFTYTGPNAYVSGSTATASVTVQSPTTVSLAAPATVLHGTDVVVTGTVLAADGPVTAGTVSYTLDGGAPVVVGTPGADGTVSFSLAGLAQGSHVIRAQYTGADNWTGSTAAAVSVVVQTVPAITLTGPSVVDTGDPVTVTATVRDGADPVTDGTVTYRVDGGPPVTAAALNGGGTVTFTIPGLTRGSHTISASYAGTGAWADSTATPITVTAQSGTELTLTAPTTLPIGEDLEIKATVSAADGPVTEGTVTYSVDGGAPVTAAALAADGTVTLTIPGLTRGNHAIAASYTGADDWTDSTATPVTVAVQSATTVALEAETPVLTSAGVTVTATVTAADGPVTDGVVRYTVNGGAPVAAGALDADGSVTFTVPGLTGGIHTIAATYTGVGGWTNSTAAPVTVTALAPTSLTLDAPATAAVGETVTLAATLTIDGSAQGGATVTFRYGDLSFVRTTDAAGVARLNLTLPRGAHPFVVNFRGADEFRADATASASVTVQSATTTTLSAPATVLHGTGPVVTATVIGADGPVTAGTVTYTVDGGAPTAAGTPDADGEVSFTPAGLTPGSHVIRAQYTGADHWTDSAAAAATVMVQTVPAITLAAPEVVDTGDPVTVTATVLDGGEPVTAGTVTYRVDGGTPVAAEALNTKGIVTFTLPGLTRGSHTISASYTGTGAWTDSTADEIVVTAQSGTAVTLSADALIPLGAELEVTAQVTAADGPVTDGTVTYTVDGGTPVAAGTPAGDGTVTFTVPGLTTGNHTIAASYTGADDWTDSAATPLEVVVDGTTTLSFTPPATIVDGEPVTLRAEVTAPASTPTGTVTFLEGTPALQTAQVLAASPTATLSGTVLGTVALVDGVAELTTTLPAGVRTITAVYAPSGGFGASSQGARIDVMPIAAAETPEAISEGDGVTLSAAGSSPAATIGWDLDGDGDHTDATGAVVTLTWAELVAFGIDDGPATHEIGIRAEVDGLISESTVELRVDNAAPTLAIVDEPVGPFVAGKPVTIRVGADDPSASDALITYRVNWGDGTPVVEVVSSEQPEVSHVFAAAGSFTVTITATDPDGDEDTLVLSLDVVAAPVSPTPSAPTTQTPGSPTPSTPTPATPTPSTPSSVRPTTPTVRPGLPSTGGGDGLAAASGLAGLLVLTAAAVAVARLRRREEPTTSRH